MFESEDILAISLYEGQVIAAVNQSFAADSQVSGSFTSVSAYEDSQSSLLDDDYAFERDESGIYDIVTNPETGDPIGIRSLEFEDPVPSETPLRRGVFRFRSGRNHGLLCCGKYLSDRG